MLGAVTFEFPQVYTLSTAYSYDKTENEMSHNTTCLRTYSVQEKVSSILDREGDFYGAPREIWAFMDFLFQISSTPIGLQVATIPLTLTELGTLPEG